jgi:hypothetical protein
MAGAAIAILFGFYLLYLAWFQRDKIDIGRQRRLNSHQFRPQPHLERKLLKLLGGKHHTANRLIQQSRLRYPDKSTDWHWEKAIYDLERDRWR